MKKTIAALLCFIIMASLNLTCFAVDNSADIEYMQSIYGENKIITSEYDERLSAVCNNGIFVGKEENEVISFKGIPFAKQPVNELRWKEAQLPDDSDSVYEAYYFGKSPIQTQWISEVGSYYKQGEDCLNLNVWKSDKVQTENKAVMVFFHGGSYGWGGTSDPLYDCQNFVENHPDVILVSVGYRTGIMGFIDFSSIEGSEGYEKSGNLGLLDMVCALKWINNNISAFGGDKDNITIFGESAGAGAVSLLAIIKEAKGLFKRVISQSGSISLTFSKEECQRLVKLFMKETGAETMSDFLALSEEELMKANEALNDYNNFPERDGIVLPENLYEQYANGEAAWADMLIGTNADETRYWIKEMEYTVGLDGEFIYSLGMPVMYESDLKKFSKQDKQTAKEFMKLQNDKRVWNVSEFYNELIFRIPSLYQAEAQTSNGGNAYVYYFTYPSAIKNLGACHAVELAYVFGNLDVELFNGKITNPELSQTMQQMWVNFAKTGDPSIEGISWEQYTSDERRTMVIGSDIHMESDIKKEQRELIEPLLKYNIAGCYTTTDYNVPSVYGYAAVVIAPLLLICIAVVILIKKLRKKA